MHDAKRDARIQAAHRILAEQGFGTIELLEEWSGEDLDDLSKHLSEEEFQILLDRFQDWEAEER